MYSTCSSVVTSVVHPPPKRNIRRPRAGVITACHSTCTGPDPGSGSVTGNPAFSDLHLRLQIHSLPSTSSTIITVTFSPSLVFLIIDNPLADGLFTSDIVIMPRPSVTILASSRVARPFSTTPPSRSVLFNLGGLAASREGQYLSKETGIPRTEYSSNIHLIRSSEVDPFAPAPGATKQAVRLAAAQSTVNQKQPSSASSARFGYSSRKQPITVDSLAQENKQIKTAMMNLEFALEEVRENMDKTSWRSLGAITTLGIVLGYTTYQIRVLQGDLESVSKEKEALIAAGGVPTLSQTTPTAIAGQAGQAQQAATPAVLITEEARPDTKSSSGGVLNWLRSSFWASGGR